MIHLAMTGQEISEVSGYIFDASTKLPLDGASVILVASGQGTVSNETGRFELKIPGNETRIKFTYVGYEELDTIFDPMQSDPLIIMLQPAITAYEEVSITATKEPDPVSTIRMGDIVIDQSQISSLPKLLGEADPIRFLQLTPGVQSSSEGGIGFYVRGGGVDQNLVLFDNTLVYNPGHLLGFISVFNPDIISDVRLIKTGIPAQFGGRLSSVVQVNPYHGHSDSLRVKGQVGMVASRISLNRSFNRKKGSFLISARGASLDLLIKPLVFPLVEDVNPFLKQSSYWFYDLNASVSYRFGQRDHVKLFAFYGKDNYSISRSQRIANTFMDWGNFFVGGRWTHVFSESMVLNTDISRTDYHFDLSGAQSVFKFALLSSVSDYSVKSDLKFYKGRHKMHFGYEVSRHTFTPNDIDVTADDLRMNFLSYDHLFAYEAGIFAESEFEISERLSASLGMRYSFFNQLGPYTEYIYDEANLLKDSIAYKKGESLARYHHPEPRLSMRYLLNDQSSLKASYMHLAQYVHLATSATVSLPTDIWLPSSRTIHPQIGDQLSLGYYRKVFNRQIDASFEVYYKHASNQLEFLRGVLVSSLNQTLEENTVSGTGTSFGAEFLLKKHAGKFSGWLGYSLSRSVRQFEQINEGMIYPAKFDRRHDFSLAGIYRLNDEWNISSVFIYVSGNAFTIPASRYIIQGNLLNHYTGVNNFRMPPYHRMDISVSRSISTKKGHNSTIDLSVYNIYNRANPFYIFFETSGDLDTYQLEVKPVLISLFPIVPTLSWKFEF